MNRKKNAESPERWNQIKRVFNAALSLPVCERNIAIKRLCQDDDLLVKEVCRLLAADESARSFMQVSAWGLLDPFHLEVSANPKYGFQIGEIVSDRFHILHFINSGGMGEVYEAWDSELHDRVALKTIRSQIASNISIIDQFKREVKQARGISHPNVCRVYDLFSHQSGTKRIWFLTMEFLQGETLLERLRKCGVFSPQATLQFTRQMVDGIAAAHQFGIIHWDFKSSNVMLIENSHEGIRAVITDFGLARTISAVGSGDDHVGQGTPGYMAPEQETGGNVGFAADQYAVGMVICEMLTGEKPDLHETSDCSRFLSDHNVPRRWGVVIRRCLQLHPEDRFKNIKEVIAALELPERQIRTAWRIGLFTAAVLFVAAWSAFFGPIRKAEEPLQGVVQLTASTDLSSEPSLSRDGQVIAYMSDRAEAGNPDIWVQHLPSGRTTRLTTHPAAEGDPSVAPDGKSVVFRSDRDGGGIYWSSTEAPGERLLVAGGRAPRFSPDGQSIVYWVGDEDRTVASGRLYLLSISGGAPIRLAADFNDARLPVWSPDGRNILFTGCRNGDQAMPLCSEWWVISRNGKEIQNTNALSGLRREGILPKGPIASWDGDNILFCARQAYTTSLWQLQLAPRNFLSSNRPQQLTSGYATNVTESSALAANGTLAFSRLSGALHVWRIDHAMDHQFRSLIKVTEDASPDISPYVTHSGEWLVFSRGSETLHNIWLKNTRSGNESLFFSSNVDKGSPIIDESGDTVVFEDRGTVSTAILVTHRGGVPKLLCKGCSKPTSWFGGNHAILYREGLRSKIKMMNLDTGESKVVVESADDSLSEARWSRENEYMLFTDFNETGKKKIYAVRLSLSSGVAAGTWIPIGDISASNDKPYWSGDGKTIFYRSTRDGFSCLWAQRFDPMSGAVKSEPIEIMHFQSIRLSPQAVTRNSFEISVAGDSIYLNLAEVSASIWIGVLNQKGATSGWYHR